MVLLLPFISTHLLGSILLDAMRTNVPQAPSSGTTSSLSAARRTSHLAIVTSVASSRMVPSSEMAVAMTGMLYASPVRWVSAMSSSRPSPPAQQWQQQIH